MSDLIEIPAPTGSRSERPLAALFRAQMRAESWETRRRWIARLIIALSVPLAYFVWSAQGRAEKGPRLVFLLWAFAFLGWCCSNVGVAMARRAVERLLTSVGGRSVPVDPEGHSGGGRDVDPRA